MALTTTGTLSSTVKPYYEKQFLLRAEENFVYAQLGLPGRIPKGEGKTVVWNRFTNPTAKTTALTEGTDPTPAGLSATLLSATLAQYGNYEQVADILDLTSIDNVIKSTIDLLAYEGALTIDTVIRDVVAAGGTAIIATAAYSNSAGFTPTRNSINSDDVLTVADVRRGVRSNKRMAAKPHTKDRYVAVAHPDVNKIASFCSNAVNKCLKLQENLFETICSETQKWGRSTTIIGNPLF